MDNMDNTLEQLHLSHHDHQHHQGHNDQIDQVLTTTANHLITQTNSMIGYDKPAPMEHNYLQGTQGHMSMMKMYFHFGLGDMVLFPGLIMDSHVKLWLTCGGLFLAALVLEMIDYSRGYLSCRCQTSRRPAKSSSPSSSHSNFVDTSNEPDARAQWDCCTSGGPACATINSTRGGQDHDYGTWADKVNYKAKFFPVYTSEPQLYRVLQASLQFVRTGLSLCLMLVAMTYNVCLIFAILSGSAIGYYIFYRPAFDSKSVMCH